VEKPFLQRPILSTVLIVLCGALVIGIIWSLSELALLYVLTDGVAAAMVVIVAAGSGTLALPLVSDHHRLPLRWQIMISTGIGLGFLSLLMLAIGALGLLSKVTCLILLVLLGVLGLASVVKRFQAAEQTDTPTPNGSGLRSTRVLILALMPFLALSLLVATVPPGLIWAEEANGYDVLEYHLQVPKEYSLANQISYLPHNIYSNFPMNAEMLYLLAMELKGSAVEAAVFAKMFNVIWGALFVLAAWLAGREYHPLAGLCSALIAGSWPWLMYLCGVAYVENGMLFFGMLALACLCRFEHQVREGRTLWGYAFLAGMFAGLACGFKYTAVPMIAGTFLVALVVFSFRGQLPKPGRSGLSFAAGALITFSPWLIKNLANTGNPVFPLGYSLFGAGPGIWTDGLAERWDRGHQAEEQDLPLFLKLIRLKERVLLDARFGTLPIMLAFPILFSRHRSRWDELCILMIIAQIIIWLFFTHLFARFMVILIIPLCLLAGRSVLASDKTWYRRGFVGCILITVGLNLVSAWSIYSAELMDEGESLRVHGRLNFFYDENIADRTPLFYLKNKLPEDRRVLSVGDAAMFYYPPNVDYCVVFNRNQFAEAAGQAEKPEDVIRWLNRKNYRYLLVNWSEIGRLYRSYGFWGEINTDLFRELMPSGLAVVQHFYDSNNNLFATLYEIRILSGLLPGASDLEGKTSG